MTEALAAAAVILVVVAVVAVGVLIAFDRVARRRP